jgi:hypothetical protein
MREFDIHLGDDVFTVAVTFKASLEIAQTVGDIFLIARESAKEALFDKKGIEYEPKWKFTLDNVTRILHIGARAAGSKLTYDQVGEMVIAAGMFQAKDEAGRYLAAIAAPGSEEVKPTKGGDAGK